jgi:uncharacterized protein (DUF924 family)
MSPEARQVLEYWFTGLDHSPAWFGERMRLWFMGGPRADNDIRARFAPLVERAEAGALATWLEAPREALALVVLLDQFALNIYRNEARGYRCSEAAIPMAKAILARGWEAVLSPAERIFLYMPLEHSENLADQELCLERFRAMAASAPAELAEVMQGSLVYAERHLSVVKRFGRFPHRNEALGRISTVEEKEFLASKEAPF